MLIGILLDKISLQEVIDQVEVIISFYDEVYSIQFSKEQRKLKKLIGITKLFVLFEYSDEINSVVGDEDFGEYFQRYFFTFLFLLVDFLENKLI